MTAAVGAARGKMRVLKVPGEGRESPACVCLPRQGQPRESEGAPRFLLSRRGSGILDPEAGARGDVGGGSRFRRLAVDVKFRGVCLALIQQLACPVVRVRRLDVRAAQLGAVEKVQLFEAIARMPEQGCRARQVPARRSR